MARTKAGVVEDRVLTAVKCLYLQSVEVNQLCSCCGGEASASWDKEEAAVEACAMQESVGGKRGKDGREPHAQMMQDPQVIHNQRGKGPAEWNGSNVCPR